MSSSGAGPSGSQDAPRDAPRLKAAAHEQEWQASEQQARNLQRANTIQAFLEATSTQLTQQGLLSLQEASSIIVAHCLKIAILSQ